MRYKKNLIITSAIIILLIITIAVPLYVSEFKNQKQIKNLKIEKQNNSAIITWTKDDADYYIIYKNNEKIDSTQKNKYIDKDIQKNKTQKYTIAPVNEKQIGQKTNIQLKAEEKNQQNEDTRKEEPLEITRKFQYIGSGEPPYVIGGRQNRADKNTTGPDVETDYYMGKKIFGSGYQGSFEEFQYIGTGTNPYLIGEIKNQGNKNIKKIKLEAAFYLGDDMIGSTRQEHYHTTELGHQIIKPQETMPFSINLEMSHYDIKQKLMGNLHKKLTIDVFIENYSTTDEEPYTQYDVSHKVDKTKKLHTITGEITNIGEKTKQTTITIEYYNETYGLIGVKKTTKNNHQPGTTKQFQITYLHSYKKIEDKETVEEIETLSQMIDSYKIKARGE